jgi:hypothetical protein
MEIPIRFRCPGNLFRFSLLLEQVIERINALVSKHVRKFLVAPDAEVHMVQLLDYASVRVAALLSQNTAFPSRPLSFHLRRIMPD